jgi:hypothetical protein
MLLRRFLPIVLAVSASFLVVRQLRIQGQEIAALRSQVRELAEAEPAPARQCPVVCATPESLPLPAASRGEATKPPVDQPVASAADAEAGEPEPISGDEQLAHLDSTFVAQPVDQRWADAQRERTSALLTSLGSTPAEIVGVDCRGSLCRAQLTLADEGRYNAFMQTLAASSELRAVGQETTVHRSPPGPDGRVAVSMYLTKEGTELPLLY